MKDVLIVIFGSIAASIITAITFIFALLLLTAPIWFIFGVIYLIRN